MERATSASRSRRWQSYSAPQWTRCTECARSKIKCSGQLPCERCWGLCLTCVPPAKSVAKANGALYVEMALSAVDFKAELGRHMVDAFTRLERAGRLDLRRLIIHMRLWAALTARAGLDVTYGLLEAARRAVAAARQEGEDLGDGDDAGAPAMAADGGAGHDAAARALASCEMFRALDDWHSAVVAVWRGDSELAGAANGAAHRWFLSAAEMERILETRHLLPCYVLASMILPDDRAAWFEAHLLAWAGSVRAPHTLFFKAWNRNGDIKLHVAKIREVSVRELPSGHVCLWTMQAVPSSHHLRKVIRQGQRMDRVFCDEWRLERTGGSSESAAPFTPVGLICLPVPPVPGPETRALLSTPQVLPPPPSRGRTPSTSGMPMVPTPLPRHVHPGGPLAAPLLCEEPPPPPPPWGPLPLPHPTHAHTGPPLAASAAAAPRPRRPSPPTDPYVGHWATLPPQEAPSPRPAPAAAASAEDPAETSTSTATSSPAPAPPGLRADDQEALHALLMLAGGRPKKRQAPDQPVGGRGRWYS